MTAARRPAAERIGIYGGTFNPVHIAHLIVAEEIRERMELDRILFIPSGVPPHKGDRMPEGRRRLEMVRLAVRGNPRFAALDLEVRREGRSYTIETLRALRRRHPGKTEFFFLIGMDAFQEITTWREAAALADYAHIVVFPRPGYPLEGLEDFFPDAWRPSPPRRWKKGIERIGLAGRRALFTVPMETLPLSASSIRRRIGEGRSVTYLVPPVVERYIMREGLYRKQHKGG